MVMMPLISTSLHSVFVNKVMRFVDILQAKPVHSIGILTCSSATLPYVTSTSSGVLLNRFSQDMTLIGQELAINMFGAVYCESLILFSF